MLSHRNLAENATCLDMKIEPGTVIMSVLPIHHTYCLSMDILKGISLGSVICINDSLMRVAKNIKLFAPNMILMVPLMIETLAKKLEDAAWMPAPIIKAKVFGNQFHTICSGGAYLNPAYIETFRKYGITILQGIIDMYNHNVPLYKRIFKLKIRETEFEKNTTKKIKRF